MRFYNIKDEYIHYLKKYDAKVADNKKGKRPYVGVVLEDSKYQRLLQNQYKCIKADREQIQLTAKRLRDMLFKKEEELSGNDRKIKERCCDLPLLEEAVKHYDNH